MACKAALKNLTNSKPKALHLTCLRRTFSAVKNVSDEFNSNRILATKFAIEFNKSIPALIKEAASIPTMPDAANRLEKIIEYTIRGGRRIRPSMILECYELLETPENLTEENWRAVKLLAGCTELFSSAYMIIDDIVDKSTVRRGSLCWYKLPDVGLKAIDDALLMFYSINAILTKNFKNKAYYIDLMELFNRLQFRSYCGQCLDDNASQNGRPDFSKFTMDYFRETASHKSAEFTLRTPVEIALIASKRATRQTLSTIIPILEEIGFFFQVQNDYEDCYDSEGATGKDGNDISQGKCTWLAIKALEKASADDKALFQESYGVNDNEKIAKILDIYNRLGIQQEYFKYEELSMKTVEGLIEKVPKEIPREMFDVISRKFYNIL